MKGRGYCEIIKWTVNGKQTINLYCGNNAQNDTAAASYLMLFVVIPITRGILDIWLWCLVFSPTL